MLNFERRDYIDDSHWHEHLSREGPESILLFQSDFLGHRLAMSAGDRVGCIDHVSVASVSDPTPVLCMASYFSRLNINRSTRKWELVTMLATCHENTMAILVLARQMIALLSRMGQRIVVQRLVDSTSKLSCSHTTPSPSFPFLIAISILSPPHPYNLGRTDRLTLRPFLC